MLSRVMRNTLALGLAEFLEVLMVRLALKYFWMFKCLNIEPLVTWQIRFMQDFCQGHDQFICSTLTIRMRIPSCL